MSTVSALACFGPNLTSALQSFGETAAVDAGQNTLGCDLLSELWWYKMRRNGNVGAGRLERFLGTAPIIHPFVDPAGPIIPAAIIFEDFVLSTIAVGACETAIGIVDHLTAATADTLVGVGFRAGVDNIWHTFVNDCPGSALPVSVRRDTVIAGKLATDPHRLTILIDGRIKTIIWKIDNIEVDRWTPLATLDQMGVAPGPKIGYTVCVPANGDATLRIHAGGQPQLRIIW